MRIKLPRLASSKRLVPLVVSSLWLLPAHALEPNKSAYLLKSGDAEQYRLDKKYRAADEARKAETKVEVPAAILVPANGMHPQLASRPFAREIAKAAKAASLDPALVHAVIFVESHYRHNVVSDKGAIGLMQVIPDTGARYGIHNLDSSQSNLRAGTLYLRDLLRMFNNRLDLALAAYNAGEGAVLRYANRIPPYRETQMYVRAVLAKYNEWRSYTLASDNVQGDTSDDAMLKARPERLEYLAGTRLNASRPLFAPTY